MWKKNSNKSYHVVIYNKICYKYGNIDVLNNNNNEWKKEFLIKDKRYLFHTNKHIEGRHLRGGKTCYEVIRNGGDPIYWKYIFLRRKIDPFYKITS